MRTTADGLEDRFDAAARRTACHMIKARARFYSRRPMALDALHPGLSTTSLATFIAIAEHLADRERRSPRRWFGFGGEIGLVNARAALLLGRTLRRDARRDMPPHMAHVGETNP